MADNNEPKTAIEALDRELHLATWLLAIPVAVVAGFLGRFVTPIGIGVGVVAVAIGLHKVIWPGRVLRVPVGRIDGAFWVSVGIALIRLFWGATGIFW